MALLALNHDVLFEILSQTDSRSALNLSMVSRKAYDLSLPQALSDVTLSRSQNQVRSFCQFILADLQNRLPYLRQLTIECTSFGVARHIEFHKTVDFSAASDIAELLAKAKRLNRLSIACFEGLIAYEPRISIAVCGIPDLADLALHNCGHLTVAMLPSLRSRPRRLAFTSLFNRSLPSFFHRLIAVDSIETLELSHLSLTDGSQPHEEIHEIPCMPSVRSLILKGCTARMSLFVRAMPNLRSLHISDVYSKVDGHSDHLKSGCWQGLAFLRGNVPDFRQWNVVCPVRQVQLDLTAFHYPDALSVIRHTSPVVLSLPMETKLIDTTFWGDFITATPRLRYLEVCLDEGRQQKLNDWMNIVPNILGNSSIVALSLCVRRTHVMGSRQEPCNKEELRSTVFRRLPERIRTTIPHLRYIGVSLANKGENPFDGRGIVPVWWRIGSARELVPVPSDSSADMRERLLNADYERGNRIQL